MATEPNRYSPQWFEFFHSGIDEARTIRQTEFTCRCAPLSDFRKILDVCCGMGRLEWQLFTPEQMEQLASSVGLSLLVSCTDFDLTTHPSPVNPRIQFLLEAT
jgi:hypothetical protein